VRGHAVRGADVNIPGDVGKRLFLWFSDDRRVEVVIRLVIVLFVFGIVIVAGVSRRHRVTSHGDETPIYQRVGNLLGDVWGRVGLLLDVTTFTDGW
jgi:hypothetical protein